MGPTGPIHPWVTEIVGDQVTVRANRLNYVGTVNPLQRRSLLARARAVLMPTLYLEPFGGVAVEAMLSGTPVVASDWGAFPEIVEEGLTGARFRTLAGGVAAIERALTLDPVKIRFRARDRFSLAAVRPQYDAWFSDLAGLWGAGWDALPPRGSAR